MHHIHITRIIPMHDLVLLIAFQDKDLNRSYVDPASQEASSQWSGLKLRTE